MPAASVLPVALHNNKLYFLFGKENELEDSAKGFSDFGGGVDSGETAIQTAMREGAEELTGFLGTKDALQKRIRQTGTHRIVYHFKDDPSNTYTIFVFPFPYDTKLVEYYNNNHAFLWDKMDKKLLSKTKLFEKIKIEWFCEDELEKRANEYRPFYKDIVQEIIAHKSKIRKFVMKKTAITRKNACIENNRTRKHMGGK
jgi:8-oxo-dGTP pyrophosphatase MutT (NUDIX family)